MRPSLLLSILVLGISSVTSAPLSTKRQGVDFYDPREGGGSFLNKSGGLGEPLNVIISGLSSPQVLTKDGFLNYARAVGMSKECLGIHVGDPQPANLGDGRGDVGERVMLREHFNVPIFGTCWESLAGGNHLRAYPQNGPRANSRALFLAVSQQKSIFEQHAIVPDGYNIGRDRLVEAALGRRSFAGVTYETTVQSLPGLLPVGSTGINHGIAIDGVVKMLTVRIV
ncbi:hypothetical protein AX16_006979 [Volvariella volvacea WC 439]|nr:hypothetical protein AX16_006979 [Volvariella volvacea WC 439]